MRNPRNAMSQPTASVMRYGRMDAQNAVMRRKMYSAICFGRYFMVCGLVIVVLINRVFQRHEVVGDMVRFGKSFTGGNVACLLKGCKVGGGDRGVETRFIASGW